MKKNVIALSLDFEGQNWRVHFSPDINEESKDPNTVIVSQATCMQGKFPPLDPDLSRAETLFFIWKEVSWAINNKLHCDLIEESK